MDFRICYTFTMTNQKTFIERLEKQLDELCPLIDKMMDNSIIYYHNTNGMRGSIVSIGHPVNHYSQKDERSQIVAREKFESFLEHVELLLLKANPETLKRTKETERKLIQFISQDRNGVPNSTESGKLFFRKQIEIFRQFLLLFKKERKELFLIPDTNAIIEYPDPKSYRKLFNEPFTFLIFPTILSELDQLKINHRNETFREKAKSVIKKLKGYRNQGDVLAGVVVDKSIIVKMVAVEPNFSNTLKWLDSNNNDDRIIVNALNVQVQHPSDRVILITSDINLQNKAQAAMLALADTDDVV